MGTRAQFYIFILVAGKRVLLYSGYGHWDGFEWISDFLTYMRSLPDNLTVEALLTHLRQRYSLEGSVSPDIEAYAEIEYIPAEPIDLDLEQLEYFPGKQASYGGRPTHYIPDFYCTPDWTCPVAIKPDTRIRER